MNLLIKARAGRATGPLADSADLVAGFINGQVNHDGGFKNRAGRSDLYYTLFGLEAFLALNVPVRRDNFLTYLRKFNASRSPDLVHLASLLRCYADLSETIVSGKLHDDLAHCIEKYRCNDGGYNNSIGVSHSTAYGCFLAFGAYQDTNSQIPDSAAFAQCLKSLHTPDGAYSNEPNAQAGSTPATAAVLTVLGQLGEPVNKSSISWLLEQCQKSGGFTAVPNAPIPDLLSTATALHALAAVDASIDNIKEPCLDFIDSLWSGNGGFYANWADKTLDCEYTYYALLAIGHLNNPHNVNANITKR